MGNFSRDTFDKLKHYVGVRLQQGVPLVDADWNEAEDIRKYELRTFLKWFVGDGVPSGNDGFHILPATGENDFIIKGGDGTPEGAGRCLVEGWDVINESDLNYTEQRLLKEADLHKTWNVDPLPALTKPTSERVDVVYLDVWEREVDADEDSNLINSDIGARTCVRLKREWVVRVGEGLDAPPGVREGHAFYVLAKLKRPAKVAVMAAHHIADQRRTGLSIASPINEIAKISNEIATISIVLEDQKYLNDADRALLLTGGGTVVWNAGTGVFTTTADLVLRPFLTTPFCKPPILWTDTGVTFKGILVPDGIIYPPRAYSGANRYTLRFVGSVTAVLGITLTGAPPARRFTLTLNTSSTPGIGTTCQQVIDLLTASGNVYRNAGFTAVLEGGVSGADLMAPVDEPVDVELPFIGALDAESHVITSAGLASFFSSHTLSENDTLCVGYDKLVTPRYGGRRQSIAEDPENRALVDYNLFLLDDYPEKLAYALPIVTRINDKLYFINNRVFENNQATGFDNAYLRRTGGSLSGSLTINNFANAGPGITATGGTGSDNAGGSFAGGTPTGAGVVASGNAGGGYGGSFESYGIYPAVNAVANGTGYGITVSAVCGSGGHLTGGDTGTGIVGLFAAGAVGGVAYPSGYTTPPNHSGIIAKAGDRSDGDGLVAVGSGTGNGVTAFSGDTGIGVQATGGNTGGKLMGGPTAVALPTGYTPPVHTGLIALAGGTGDGVGVVAVGNGAGAGVVGYGGATGNGVIGHTPYCDESGAGVKGTALGKASGVRGETIGGGSGVLGVVIGNGAGVDGEATGTGAGVSGCSSLGYGGVFSANATRGQLRLAPSAVKPACTEEGAIWYADGAHLRMGGGGLIGWRGVHRQVILSGPPLDASLASLSSVTPTRYLRTGGTTETKADLGFISYAPDLYTSIELTMQAYIWAITPEPAKFDLELRVTSYWYPSPYEAGSLMHHTFSWPGRQASDLDNVLLNPTHMVQDYALVPSVLYTPVGVRVLGCLYMYNKGTTTPYTGTAKITVLACVVSLTDDVY